MEQTNLRLADVNNLFFDAVCPAYFVTKRYVWTKNKTMALINPHINFNGNAEEAFNFYKSVFGGEFTKVVRFKDIPNPQFQIPEKEKNKIMHIALPIGNNVLMANDVPEFLGKVNEKENRSKISISTGSKEEADKLFN